MQAKLRRLIFFPLLLVVGLQTSINAMPWGNDLIVKSKLVMGSKKFVFRVPILETVVICLELSLR